VTISVPKASLGGLTNGDKLDHVIAYTLVEHADVTLNDWADQAKSFSYVIGSAPPAQHQPDGYVEVATNPAGPWTRAILSATTNTWTAAIAGAPIGGTVYARQILSKDLYTSLWDDVQAGPVAVYPYSFGADLKLAMSADTTSAHLGQPVTYTLNVSNLGPATAQGITLTDTFSKNAGFASVTATRGAWSCTVKPTKRLITCILASLASGDYATLTLVLKPTAKGTMTNTATVSEQSPGDPNTANNTASVSVTVTP
jgi:uncharacterized repeat protein (TIGR01451 family)